MIVVEKLPVQMCMLTALHKYKRWKFITRKTNDDDHDNNNNNNVRNYYQLVPKEASANKPSDLR